MQIAPDDPQRPAVRSLISAHAAQSSAAYPAESNHNLGAEALVAAAPFLTARVGETAIAMGALMALEAPGEVELKSMYVAPEHRGAGTGTAILDALIADARDAGYRVMRLETGSGPSSSQARRLYASRGFVETEPFPPYDDDPHSIFMALDLTAPAKRQTRD